MVIGVVPKRITVVDRQNALTSGLFQVTTPYFYDPINGAIQPVGLVTQAPSLRGPLYNFDGSSSLRYVNDRKLTPPFTVAFDVIFQTVGFDVFQVIVSQGGVGVTNGFKVAIASNGIRVTFGGVADYFISNSTVANTLYRVCVTVSGNGGTAIAYKNGASVGSVAVGTMATPASTGTVIGADPVSFVLSGTRIGNVALWNRALSADEVLLLNNSSLLSTQPRYVQTDSTPSPTSRTFFVPRKKIMSSQPQGSSVAINWDNPITRNLTIAYLPTYRFPVQDIVTGIFASGATQLTPVPGTNGVVGANTGINVRPLMQFDTAGQLGPNGVNGYNISLFALFEQYDTTTTGAIWGGGNSASIHARFEKNADGTLSFRPNSNSAGPQITGPVLDTNRVYALGGVGIGVFREFFINGVSVASANNAITINNNVFNFAGTYNVSPSTNYMRGGLYCAYVWSRALTSTEIKSLSDNPYQVFKQPRLSPALAEDGKVYAPFMS